MKTFFYGLLIFLSSSIAYANYSNMIVFGDSQSDIGNMPESGNIADPKLHVLHYYYGIPYNLYIPASNPVVANDDALLAQALNFSQLPAQPLIAQKFARQGRSVNWSQYLFAALNTQGQLHSALFLPWLSVYQNAHAPAANTSVDYSFAGAMSVDHCNDESYQPLTDQVCNEAQVSASAAQYRADTSNDNLRNQVIIPGAQRQVDFFAEDVQAGRVQVDAHTLYIIWTGANDLGADFHYLLNGDITLFAHNLDVTMPEQTVLAAQHLYQLGARNIVVIGQQNLGLTPIASRITGFDHNFYERYLNAYVLNLLVLSYNIHLSRDLVALQKQSPDLNLQYLDLQSLYNQRSFIPGQEYFKNLGLACQNQSAATFAAITQGQLMECPNYLYWNGSHMTDEANQLLVKALLKQVSPGSST